MTPVERFGQSRALDFPGAFTAAVVFGGMAVFGFAAWPWLALHGTARIVWGVVWSMFLALIGALVILGMIAGRRDVR